LWRNPELELAQQWKRDTRPTVAWARRYDEFFDHTMAFLDRSLAERDRTAMERERERRAKLRRAQWTAVVLGTLLVLASGLAVVALRERARAEQNLGLARQAVDESLSSADRDPARATADVPQVEEFRRELLGKAQQFYQAFMQQAPDSERSRRDLASAHFLLGQINRMLDKPEEATRQYQDAIGRFEALARAAPRNGDYRAALANAHNWLGETLRPFPARAADATQAYDRAIQLQQALVAEHGDNGVYPKELARTLNNRGILRASANDAAAAEKDFRDAIALLQPVAGGDDRAAQELARAYNNAGGLLYADSARGRNVRDLWERAIAIDERLAAKDPGNREYKFELAQFCGNLAALLHEQGDDAEADRRSRQALQLFESLARVPPSLGIHRADAHNLRATILQAQRAGDSEREYAEALALFEQLREDPAARRLSDFHERFGDLLLNLAAFPGTGGPEADRRLLSRASAAYEQLVEEIATSGSRGDAQLALDTLARIISGLPEPDRGRLARARDRLLRKLNGPAAR
jgi:hypothetical protein